jgi:hypothetical protein
MKKLPVEVDVVELLVKVAMTPGATAKTKAIADLCMIAFYYLLRIGEYTGTGLKAQEKQTELFCMKDVTFFRKDTRGKITQVATSAVDDDIFEAISSTLTLGNQKNGWKGACIHHEGTGDPIFCPTKALARRFCHIRKYCKGDMTVPLCTCYTAGGTRMEVTDKDIRAALKSAATMLNYPSERGIPIERIDTHSLRSGGANALALAGYSEHQIQKMGRWKGKTFKEYIRDELHCFSEGMSRAMKKVLGYVNIAGGVYHDVTSTVIASEYNMCAAGA